MAHWRSFTDRETLGAWDLVDKDGKPRDVVAEIARVVGGTVKSQERPKGERRPFIYFTTAKKPLVCNATNAKTLSSLAGSEDVKDWIGLRVTLYQASVKAKGGELVQGIRIRTRKATATTEPIADQPVDEEMRNAQKAGAGEEPTQ